MTKPSLSVLFDILLDRWSSFLGSIDIVVLTYILNEIIKDDMKLLRKTIKDISDGCGCSFPSVFKALERAETFGILAIKHDEKISKIYFGKKLRLEMEKKKC
jgi:hypothetical protein